MESIVQSLLICRLRRKVIKTSSSKIGSKNANSSKVSCHTVELHCSLQQPLLTGQVERALLQQQQGQGQDHGEGNGDPDTESRFGSGRKASFP